MMNMQTDSENGRLSPVILGLAAAVLGFIDEADYNRGIGTENGSQRGVE